MKKVLYMCIVSIMLMTACNSKEVVEPINPNDRPQIILFDDEEAGEREDSDETSFSLKLLDRIDPTGKELGGKVTPLKGTATVNFQITDIEGFNNIQDYILGAEGEYEIDDCEDASLPVTLNTTTGVGSVTFPAGVEEIQVNLELADGLFDDNIVNDDDRGFKVKILSITGNTEPVVANTSIVFEHKVLDDEVVFAEWEMDVDDDLADFKALFGNLDSDIADLQAADIDKIKFEFGLNELAIEIELVEEETNDCGDKEQKKIEIEAEYDDLTDDAKSGDIKFIVEVETDKGVEEVEYEGTFSIVNDEMTITLTIDDEERTLKLYLD